MTYDESRMFEGRQGELQSRSPAELLPWPGRASRSLSGKASSFTRTQRKIAAALGLAEDEIGSVFNGRRDALATTRARDVTPAVPEMAEECLELLRAFARVTDPDKRRQCLDLVVAAAHSGDASSS
ncbi:hypothetical protein [Methylobacterium crusticola]|nr:hypothetical protein [Methylobacterium crusticola]